MIRCDKMIKGDRMCGAVPSEGFWLAPPSPSLLAETHRHLITLLASVSLAKTKSKEIPEPVLETR